MLKKLAVILLLLAGSSALAQLPPDAPIRVIPLRESALPMLITAEGALLLPDENGVWEQTDLPVPVRDAYLDAEGNLWAATEEGVYRYQDEEWEKINNQPSLRLVDTHGHVFALGDGQITRFDDADSTLLDVPNGDAPADEFVMLGNHSHVLHNGQEIFITGDLGLSWRPLEAPAPVKYISTGALGNLLVSTNEGVYVWSWSNGKWNKVASFTASDMQVYRDTLYMTADGSLYRAGKAIDLPDSEGAFFTDLAFQYPDTLWVLDSEGRRLWSTQDGEEWTQTPITLPS